MKTPKVIILGAGYGGLITSRELEKILKTGEADVTIINKHDYHYISTQLHKIGAGTSADDKIALHIPNLYKKNLVKFLKATVSHVDFNTKQVFLENNETMEYDYLLISLGFDVDTFNVPGVQEHAFKLRSFRSAKRIYNHLIKQFSAYKEDKDPARLTFVVAGAGFTGIEMVGELIDAIPKLCKTYDIPFEDTRIINIEAANTVFPGFDKKAVDFTTNYLQKKQVEVMTSTKILECSPTSVVLDNGTILPSRTLIWSCGVRGNQLLEKLNLPLTRKRIPVDPYLRVQGLDNVFCIGDAALCRKDGNSLLPPTAQVAIQQAQVCGPNIAAAIRGQKLKTFKYHHKGTVASIGSLEAVGNAFGIKFTGIFAAFMKQVVETRYLLILGGPSLVAKQHGFRRKINSQISLSSQK